MNYEITKQIDFCYGHRVWSQKLISEYSVDSQCACRHLHGDQGKILVTLESDKLNDGMVTDFKHLNWFKKFIDDVLDHKFIIDSRDPMFDYIIPWSAILEEPSYRDYKYPLILKEEGYSIIDPKVIEKQTDINLINLLEGFVIVDFIPTSEYLSNWLYGIINEKMSKIGIKTKSVHFFETPKSSSKYTHNDNIQCEG